MPQSGKPQVTQPIKCDVLLLVILNEEWQTFLTVFPEATSGFTTHELEGLHIGSTEFDCAGYRVVAATLNPISSEEKTQGKVPAAVLTAVMLSKYEPSTLVNIGIACRINKSDCKLGEVVVATNLQDVTGNCSVEGDSKNGGMPKFRSGKPSIPCDKEIRKRLIRLKETHSTDYEQWNAKSIAELKALGVLYSEEFAREGVIATGDPLAKSEVFHEIVKDNLRTTLAYEMEAYSIAETAGLMHKNPGLLVLKGLSDDGDGKKNQLENYTGGKLRTVASENALRLFRLSMEAGIFPSLRPTTTTKTEAPTTPRTTINTSNLQGFPYFSPDDFKNLNKLKKALCSETNSRMEWLRRSVQTTDSEVASALTQVADKELVSRWLNCAVDSTFYAEAGWVVEDTIRLKKIVNESFSEPKFKEHKQPIVNRLLIEHELEEFAKGCLVRETPIITCLIEDTGLSGAIEHYKTGFQRKHRVVIDFDAQPLADLYKISNEELISGESSKYDIVFHYHLAVTRFFNLGVIVSLDQKRLEYLASQLIPEVEKECCFVLDKQGKPKKTIIPVNANSVVLVINDEIFERYTSEYNQWIRGTYKLESPATWDHFRSIVEFFETKYASGEKVYGMVPQGMRAGDSLYFEWCNIAYSMGGGVFGKEHGWAASKPEDVILDQAPTIKATNFYKYLYERCPRDVDPSMLDAKKQIERFVKGDTAMAFIWSDALPLLFSSSDSLKLSAHVIPGNKSMVGGGVCCVRNGSGNRELAQLFVEGLLEPSVQSLLSANGWFSGFREVYKDPNVMKLPYSNAVRESLLRATYMIEAGPNSARIREIVGESLERIVKGTGDPAATLRSTASLLRKGFAR